MVEDGSVTFVIEGLEISNVTILNAIRVLDNVSRWSILGRLADSTGYPHSDYNASVSERKEAVVAVISKVLEGIKKHKVEGKLYNTPSKMELAVQLGIKEAIPLIEMIWRGRRGSRNLKLNAISSINNLNPEHASMLLAQDSRKRLVKHALEFIKPIKIHFGLGSAHHSIRTVPRTLCRL